MDRVCVIGAGSSGIAACQVLHARGVPYDCFEAGSAIGGNWRYLNDNGMSSAYRSLHINSSRSSMEYAAYRMPADWPSYLGHRVIARYFDDYVDHFGFRHTITFRTVVTRVRPAPGGGWDVTTRHRDSGTEDTRRYRAVLVANGHHWDPRYPDPPYPGTETFTGERMHSHHYRTPDRFAGKRVLVLGIGNSAADIAVEASQVADRTVLAMRRGAHVMPKFVFGVPIDHLTLSWMANLPLRLQSRALELVARLARGKITSYGLQRPDHDALCAHPTVSDSLLSKLGHGDIVVKPNLARLDGDKVWFVDGSVEATDLIVYCTGYRISFPFLGRDVIDPANNEVSLYRRVVSVEHAGLYFIGLVQPIGAIMPLAEAQSEWVADLLTGVVTLPPVEDMRREIRSHRDVMGRRYVRSQRHTIQVDFLKYRKELQRERRVCARRPS